MPFKWEYPENKNSAWVNFTDGERRALYAWRSRNDPSLKPKERGSNIVLCWEGATPHLPDFLGRYLRIRDGLCRLNPQYAPNWDSVIAAEVHFNLPKEEGQNLAVCGTDSLVLYNAPVPSGRFEELLARHAGYWECAVLASSDHEEALRMLVTSGTEGECECSFREYGPGLTKLPLDDLAAVIESSTPVVARYRENGNDLDTVKFEPWPLSHNELLAALDALEQMWSLKPLSRKKLAALRKEMAARA